MSVGGEFIQDVSCLWSVFSSRWAAIHRECLDSACLFRSLQSTFSPLCSQFPLGARKLHLKGDEWGRFCFQQGQSLADTSLKTFTKNLSRGAGGSICHLCVGADGTESQGRLRPSDLAEMLFCNVKIVQNRCRGLCACQRSFFQMQLWRRKGGLGSFPLCVASERWRWSGWMRCHSKVGAILNS